MIFDVIVANHNFYTFFQFIVQTNKNNMKKKLFLICAFAMAGLSMISCNSDDEDFERSIVGKWNYNKTIVSTNGGTPVDSPYNEHEEGCNKDYVEFVQGGVFRDVILFKNQQGVCTEDTAPNSTWTKDNSTLTIGNDVYTIVTLNGSELRYENTTDVSGVPVKVVKVYTKN
mgnify:CR=1 FL=1